MKHAIVAALLACPAVAYAAEQHVYQKAKLIQMTSTVCNSQKDAEADPGRLLVPDDREAPAAPQKQCPEYKLQTEKALYVIRPRDTKRAALLPVGETALFRIKDDYLVLRVNALDSRERDYKVISITALGTEVAEEITVW